MQGCQAGARWQRIGFPPQISTARNIAAERTAGWWREQVGKSAEFHKIPPATDRGWLAGRRLQLWNQLVGPHLEGREDMWPERVDQRNIRGVATAGNDDASHAALVVPGIEREPTILEVHLDPGAEVHGRWIARHADVAEVAVDIAGGNVEAAAQGDHQVREVAAYA